jgi:hypothetical protein
VPQHVGDVHRHAGSQKPACQALPQTMDPFLPTNHMR